MIRPETTRALENDGSRAQARFLYQHHYIAYWCMQMLIDTNIEHIVCEHHDDFFIRWRNDNYSFVQVKTRSDGEGEWSIAKITQGTNIHPDKGLSIMQKLYQKHLAFGEGRTNQYILVSDMGAGEPSVPNLHTLQTLKKKGDKNWSDDDVVLFEKIFEEVKNKISDAEEQFLRGFLLFFDFRKWQPNTKQSLERFNHSELREIMYKLHGEYYDDPHIRNLYEELLTLIRNANVIEDDANLGESVEQKTIKPEQVKSIITAPLRSKLYLERTTDPIDEDENQQLTKLQEKTRDAGWDPDATIHLMDLRASRNSLYRQRCHFDVIRKRLDDISLKVQRICLRVKMESQRDQLDGCQQWLLLDKYLSELATQNDSLALPISVDYLFGETGNLTGLCKIRWC